MIHQSTLLWLAAYALTTSANPIAQQAAPIPALTVPVVPNGVSPSFVVSAI